MSLLKPIMEPLLQAFPTAQFLRALRVRQGNVSFSACLELTCKIQSPGWCEQPVLLSSLEIGPWVGVLGGRKTSVYTTGLSSIKNTFSVSFPGERGKKIVLFNSRNFLRVNVSIV